MRKHLLLVFLVALSFSFALNAQERKCAANDVMEEQIAKNPSFANKLLAIEKQTQHFIDIHKSANAVKGKPTNPGGGNNGGGSGGGGGTTNPIDVVIPVVVHVLYNTSGQNISDNRITEQIKILNDDFAATNTDNNSYIPSVYQPVVSGATGIKFCLVHTERKATSVTSFSTNDAMKHSSSGGSDAIDPEHNLNIWVCNMGGGILGYAQFPGGNLSTDGVVILYSAFGKTGGNYGLGRTATHEVGHYFNLRHIWGDRRCGSDLVDDTPLHDGANYGCPGAGATSNCKGPVVEMWMNYMDYTYDQCMYMFSADQALRMQATLAASGPRAIMGQNNTCPQAFTSRSTALVPEAGIAKTTFKIYPSITTGNVFVELQSGKAGLAELAVYNAAGIMVARKKLSVSEGMNVQEISLGNLANGYYVTRLQENNKTHLQKLVVQH